jgi:hypothetical protein
VNKWLLSRTVVCWMVEMLARLRERLLESEKVRELEKLESEQLGRGLKIKKGTLPVERGKVQWEWEWEWFDRYVGQNSDQEEQCLD